MAEAQSAPRQASLVSIRLLFFGGPLRMSCDENGAHGYFNYYRVSRSGVVFRKCDPNVIECSAYDAKWNENTRHRVFVQPERQCSLIKNREHSIAWWECKDNIFEATAEHFQLINLIAKLFASPTRAEHEPVERKAENVEIHIKTIDWTESLWKSNSWLKCLMLQKWKFKSILDSSATGGMLNVCSHLVFKTIFLLQLSRSNGISVIWRNQVDSFKWQTLTEWKARQRHEAHEENFKVTASASTVIVASISHLMSQSVSWCVVAHSSTQHIFCSFFTRANCIASIWAAADVLGGVTSVVRYEIGFTTRRVFSRRIYGDYAARVHCTYMNSLFRVIIPHAGRRKAENSDEKQMLRHFCRLQKACRLMFSWLERSKWSGKLWLGL